MGLGTGDDRERQGGLLPLQGIPYKVTSFLLISLSCLSHCFLGVATNCQFKKGDVWSIDINNVRARRCCC